MDIKEARELVESRKKDDPDYAKAVKRCIKADEVKDDEAEVKKDSPKKKVK